MTPSRPYLLRALNEWILDNDCTPYVVVDANGEGVQVPSQYISDGQIVLNINPSAVRNLLMTNDAVSFEARFSGKPMTVYVPIKSVMAVYAKENGQGMAFGWESGPGGPDTPPDPNGNGTKPKSESEAKPKQEKKGSRPQLKVVK